MQYTVDLLNGVFICKASGQATPVRVEELLDTVLAHSEWRPGMPLVFDYSELDTSSLSANDVKWLADIGLPRKDKIGNGKTAVVVSRDLEYGLIRMFQVYVEEKVDTDFQLFRSRDDALRWVGS